jgi:hypothetical protein
MATADTYPRLIDGLEGVRRQWRMQKVLEGVLLAGAVTAAVLLLAIAADNLLRLDHFGRAVLSAVLWGSAIAGFLTWVLRRVLEDRRDDFFAALVEERHPELSNRLINALQLGRGNNHHGSRRLIDAIVDDAAKATADMELADCLDWRTVRRVGLIAAGIALLIGLYALLPLWSLNQRFGNGLVRVLVPWSAVPPYAATRIADKDVAPGSGSHRFPEGASVTIQARVTGDAIAADARLMRREGDRWRGAAMQPVAGSPGLFTFTVADAVASFDYYITAGDGRSRQFPIEIVPRPRVELLTVRYMPPAYTGQAAGEAIETDGELAAIAGTRVELELRSTKPLQSGPSRPAASLLTDGGQVIALAQGDDPQTWRAAFTVTSKDATLSGSLGQMVAAPARYQFRLLDTDGYENADPLWHAIALAKDQPPSIALTAPGRDVQLQPGDKLTVRLAAKDDYGLADARIAYRVNDETQVRELVHYPIEAGDVRDLAESLEWDLAATGLNAGDLVYYWAVATDRNDITGPGQAESRRHSIFVIQPEEVLQRLDEMLLDYAEVLEELVRLQRENRAQTASSIEFPTLVTRQTLIRLKTRQLADRMRQEANPAESMVTTLDELHAGLLADCIRLLEGGRDTSDRAKATAAREQSLPVQDAIIEKLQALLARLQRNEQARAALKKLAKSDQQAHWAITTRLNAMTDDLERLLAEEEELTDRFEKLPKKSVDELSEEQMLALDEFDEFQERWNKWAQGSIDELTKLPTGFVDDFGMREDVNRIFQEIEKAASRSKSEKLEVALEDLGAGLATEMLEDLEVWMPDSPDATQWVLEEPNMDRPFNVPEMPLPSELEDMVGDLLQDAEEFDQEADDITSAWGDNLNQAGWDVADGPISNFSAKGKTGNDLPNNMEVSGRAGDGRRGKSSGQMVGDTARALEGRKTPARVNNERYEPGQLKQEGEQDPNGATGGGKKAGAGRRGLQGGTPPDFVRDMQRLSEKQAAVREKAEQVAKELDQAGVKSARLTKSIDLMKSVEDDLRDTRYEDAARRRKTALSELKNAFTGAAESTAVDLSRARELPGELRDELLQSADEGYPQGYESLLKSYYRALSEE